jgi:hypothetical protein
MATDDNAPSARLRWARLRFQILGPLLAAPADDGELKTRIAELAARPWRNPTTGESVRFSFKTIERWWYTARGVDDPISALARKVPSHAGTHPSVGPALAEAIATQHRDHPRWTFQLHYDNVLALAREDLPLDKARNAERIRRIVGPGDVEPSKHVGIAPHLRALMADYAATGLPPAYLPKHDSTDDSQEDS